MSINTAGEDKFYFVCEFRIRLNVKTQFIGKVTIVFIFFVNTFIYQSVAIVIYAIGDGTPGVIDTV